MDNTLNRIILFSFFFILGMFFHRLFLTEKPRVITTIEKTTDTVFVQKIDTIRISQTQIRHEIVRDTVLIDFKPQIRRFETSFSTNWGNATVTGESLGKVLNMDFISDFNIPVVTNTINTTNTIVKKPAGLYVGAGIQVGGNLSNFSASGNIHYLKDRHLFGYSYGLDGSHAVSYSRKLF